jgi:predicted PurR-regulated permease PerM
MFLSFLVVKPFVNVILASIVIAYIFYPVYKFINKKVLNKTICALLVSLFIIMLIVVPFALLLPASASEAQYTYIRSKQKISTGELFDIKCEDKESLLCASSAWFKSIVAKPEIKFYLQDILEKVTNFAIEKTSGMLLALPGMILNIVVTFFILFYLLRDGHKLTAYMKQLIPMEAIHRHHVYSKIKEVAHAVIYGSIVIAVIQGLLGMFGYWLFGVESFIFWGLATAVFALVPIVGTAMIWGPAGLFLILQGTSEGNPTLIYSGIGLLIYGGVIVAGADNVLKPKLIGDRAGLHPVLVLLGVLGGLALFGFAGFLIGPLILAILKSLLDIYEKERGYHNHDTKS